MVSPKSHGPVRADITGDDVGQSYIKKCGYNLTPLREQQKIQYIMWLTHWEKAYHLFVFRYYDPIIFIYIYKYLHNMANNQPGHGYPHGARSHPSTSGAMLQAAHAAPLQAI